MRLKNAHVRNYRSIRDTGVFDIEYGKTILVGPNEAGKTAILQAIQQIRAPKGIKGFDALRDYPRALYNDITTGKAKPEDVPVVTVTFELDDNDRVELPASLKDVGYTYTRYLDNSATHSLLDAPPLPTFGMVKNDLARLAAHIDKRAAVADGATPSTEHADKIAELTNGWRDTTRLTTKPSAQLRAWVEAAVPLIDEGDEKQEDRLARLQSVFGESLLHDHALKALDNRIPVFVLFSNYFRVRPLIHLEHLATRLESKLLDDDQYDYGNSCLLKLLGFSARHLSDLGRAVEPQADQSGQLQRYRDQLDQRSYQLNAASVTLTNEIKSVWHPSSTRPEADRLRLVADGQYLKAVVEDDLGVEVELDQRSEGFQWLVSFFVVFFAESMGEHENAVLLLDEPGLSLHGLKQREFRDTISRLAEKNQTIYTTHSPFLVGPDELDLVRVVELNDRKEGTKVHTSVTSSDPAALLPLQEALGYDLAQSLFAQQRNLILEGLTDYWYLEATSSLLADADVVKLNEKIALIPANTAGKVMYFATILHAHSLKVAALLDSDNAGDQAAKQEVLVHTLGAKGILRTKDYVDGVPKAEIEDLLRDTLPVIARDELGIDVVKQAKANPAKPIVELLAAADKNFSKYRLAKAFIRWSRDNEAKNLSKQEREGFTKLIGAINAAVR